jgi:hypothetical protein
VHHPGKALDAAAPADFFVEHYHLIAQTGVSVSTAAEWLTVI